MSNEIQKTEVSNNAPVVAGFGTLDSFNLMYRQAKLIASSTIVPEQFSIYKNGKLKNEQEQNLAIANAVICLELSMRMNESALAIAQNIYLIHGRPGWSSQYLIAKINTCGKFSYDLQFELTDPEPERFVEATITEYVNGQPTTKTIKEKIKNRICVAWSLSKNTGKRIESIPVSIEMAVQEGWYSKKGSKWKTMELMMLQYRAATFFSSLHCPELKMGMKTVEELHDIIDITPINETTSKTSILGGFSSSDSILPTSAEIVVPLAAEEKPAVSEEKATTKQPAPPVEVVKEESTATVADPASAAEEEVIPADKLAFMYLDELSRMTGETQDDLLDEYSKHKYGCIADLVGALGDKTKLTLAYLNDVLVPALKAKATDVADQQQEA